MVTHMHRMHCVKQSHLEICIVQLLQDDACQSLLCACSLNPDDSSKGLTLQGPLGGLVRRAAYLYRQPTDQHRFKLGRDWVQSALDNAQGMLSGSRQAR